MRGGGGECCLEGCYRFAADTVVERGSKEWRRLEEGDRGGHGLKIGPFREIRGALEVPKRCFKWDQEVNYESLRYGCETWALTLREERKLRVFENMVLRRIFGPRRDEVTGNGGHCLTRSLMICTPHPILCG